MSDVVIVHSSPRKGMNTAALAESASSGLAAAGHSTRAHALYELRFKGCSSCFACKREHGPSYGRCALKDDLAPVLEEIRGCRALILASPIYFGGVNAAMRAFLERLLFQSLLYTSPPSAVPGPRIKVGMIYAMNVREDQFLGHPMKAQLELLEASIARALGELKTFYAFDTDQLKDYEDVQYTYTDWRARRERQRVEFPKRLAAVADFARALV